MQCFVIGPIGDANSETRQNADQLYDYLIQPVLSPLNFEVIRADRLKTVASITDEIIKLIQTAELCIIDLSESNPNVYYEAGRRHETGKPYIHLIKSNQRVPFDVQGVRYIIYDDLSLTPNVFQAQNELRQFVELIMKSGFGASRSVNPFNNLEESIRRVEARLSDLTLTMNLGSSRHQQLNLENREEDGLEGFIDPRQRLIEAIRTHNYRSAERALVELDEISVDKNEIVQSAAILASAGRRPASDIIIKYVSTPDLRRILSHSTIAGSISALSRYFILTGQAETGKAQIYQIVDELIASPEFEPYPSNNKSVVANSGQRIAYYTGDQENARKYVELAMAYEPDESAWVYNASTVYFEAGDQYKAAQMFDKYEEMIEGDNRELDGEHFTIGAKIYAACKQMDKTKSMIDKLAAIDRRAAQELRAELLK